MTHQADLELFIQHFETLTRDTLSTLSDVYAANAFFKDPFNEVRGRSAIISIFEHMFNQVDEPRFVVISKIMQGDDAFIAWDFLFRLKNGDRAKQCIHGSSYLRFGPDRKVHYHRDYWDAAEELYEKIPVLGSLMRFMKRRMQG